MENYPIRWKELFWKRVEIGEEDQCWEWKGSIKKTDGYGYHHFHDRTMHAHRVAYTLEHGEVPRELSVCHVCDNRICCNPNHLFLGTHSENMHDMRKKCRQRRGETKPTARLTECQVRAIRSEYAQGGVRQIDLAHQYGVSDSQIWSIIHRKKWAWLK